MNRHISLVEDTKSQLLAKSRRADNYAAGNQYKGKNRFQRRAYSTVANSVREFNKINMAKLFAQDILDVNILVHGETNNYSVKVSFSGILDLLRDQMERNGRTPEDAIYITDVMRALTRAFDTTDVYIHCTCPDFKYRFGWWALANDTSSFTERETKYNRDVENRIVVNNGPVVTNPQDSKGAGCKHCMLVLNNNTWLIKVASVIRNYINFMKARYEQTYGEKIYPVLYGTETEYQMNFLDPKELDSPYYQGDEETDDNIDAANKWARTRGQFQKGNIPHNKRIKDDDEIPDDEKVFDMPGQRSFNFDSLMSDSE